MGCGGQGTGRWAAGRVPAHAKPGGVRPKVIFKVLLRYGISIITVKEGPELPVFEFDPAKSAANRVKHGIDFVATQALWLDDRLLEVPTRVEEMLAYDRRRV